jgi:cytochrome c oxidase subunit 1
MLNETLGRIHFWATFVGTFFIFFPMHFLGLMGVPRRYATLEGLNFVPPSAHMLNEIITAIALLVGVAQLLFGFNLVYSYFRGTKAPDNPWGAATLEWQTPSPPPHGNWGPEPPPVVYRWPYEYSPPDHEADFIPQNAPPVLSGGAEEGEDA